MDRQPLTTELVDGTPAPERGERSIADTVEPGLILRLWAGGGRALCLRYRGHARRTFRPGVDAVVPWGLIEEPEAQARYAQSLGVWLDLARDWARAEKRRLDGELGEAEQYSAERVRYATLTLRDHVERFFDEGPGAMSKPAYRDHVDQLIHDDLAPLLDRPLGEITAEDLVAELVQPRRPPANMTRVRNVLSKLARDDALCGAARHLEATRYTQHYKAAVSEVWDAGRDTLTRDIDEVLGDTMARLKAEQEEIVTAMALRMYVTTGAKQRPLLAARWNMLLDGFWYPYLPDSRSTWFEARERLPEDLLRDLELYRVEIAYRFPGTPFLFSSAEHGGTAPITSVQRHWRRQVKSPGLALKSGAEVKLKPFAAMSVSRTRPSAVSSQNDSFEAPFREIWGEEKKRVFQILSKSSEI